MRSSLVDRIAHRLGYVRWDRVIQGSVEWKSNEQTFVDLTIPGGQRVWGWVDPRLDARQHVVSASFD